MRVFFAGKVSNDRLSLFRSGQLSHVPDFSLIFCTVHYRAWFLSVLALDGIPESPDCENRGVKIKFIYC
jgi:hypothetical protein